MKILLISIFPKDTIANYLLSSYILKGYLLKYHSIAGLSVDVMNFHESSNVEKICEKILAEKPDVIGYSCYTWNIKKIEAIIDIVSGKIEAFHVLGGPEISLERIKTFKNKSDSFFYVIGEGEKVFLELLKYIELKSHGKIIEFPKGIAFRSGDKLSIENNEEHISDLDSIPSIYLNGIIDERYYERQQAFLETQRGCRFKCKYCVYHKNLNQVSYYSLERIYGELDHLIIKTKISALRIFDPIFTSNIDRAKSIVRHLIDMKENKNINLPWIYWEMTLHNIDKEFIELVGALKKRDNINNSETLIPKNMPQHFSEMLSDYTAVNCYGIQSFNEASLRAVNRTVVNKARLIDFLKMVNGSNIVLKIDLILGLPLETVDTYLEGLEYFLPLLNNTDHILNIHRLQILPGSELEKICPDYGIEYSIDSPHMVLSHKTMSFEDFGYLSKITALLVRIINSPLRKYLYKEKLRTGKKYIDLIKELLDKITGTAMFSRTKLVLLKDVDDDYWNNEIYKEINTVWIIENLNGTAPLSE